MPHDRQPLQDFFTPHISLTPAEWDSFLAPWQPLRAPRKTILTAAGETERYVYFVMHGVQRAFYLGERDRQEATLVFTYAPSLSGVADSFLTQSPSFCYFETLTASQFLRLSHDAFTALLLSQPKLQALMLKLTALSLRGVLLRQAELQCFTAEEKFRALLTRSPHLLHLVPHKYLASYLGIDATNFSKLLSSVRI